jgi:hypothetical protein
MISKYGLQQVQVIGVASKYAVFVTLMGVPNDSKYPLSGGIKQGIRDQITGVGV